MEKIFISGPMVGFEKFNFTRFDEVAELMRKHGHDVVNPADICREYRKNDVTENNEVFSAMISKEQEIERTCSAILLLDGWECSVGVRRELKTAIEGNFDIYQERHFPFLSDRREVNAL